MKVRHNPAMGVSFLVIGTGFLLLGLQRIALGDFTLAVVLGLVVMLNGILQLTRPYLEYDLDTRTIAVKSLIGSRARRFGGLDGGRLGIADNRVVCTRADGRTTKVPVYRFLAKGSEWDAMLVKLG